MLLSLLTGLAIAAPPTVEPAPSKPADTGEYFRLSQEIVKLSSRNAWSGVTRLWPELLATGVELSLHDWIAGAHAARAVGNAAECRYRLDNARDLVDDADTEREIIEWLAEIDTHYGKVSLKCDLAKKPAVLEVSTMPFKPDMQQAIGFAIERVTKECDFDGMLPAGTYTFVVGDKRTDLQVSPKVSSVQIDLRRHDRKKKK